MPCILEVLVSDYPVAFALEELSDCLDEWLL